MGGRFVDYGDIIRRHPSEGGPFSIVRRGRGIDIEVAPIGSFNCRDGSVFIQKFNNNNNSSDNDNLTLTLHKTDGKRFRFPPLIHHIPLQHFTSMDRLKSYVLMRTRDSLYIKWIGHMSTYGEAMEAAAARGHTATARNQLVNSLQNLNLGDSMGDVIRRHPSEEGPFSIVRRNRGIDIEVAPIGSFNCRDGSVFIQEFNNNNNNSNNDNLTLTLHKTDGKRFRFPPLVHQIPLQHFTSMDRLESYVLMRTRDSLYIKWIGHMSTYGAAMEAVAARRHTAAARNELVNSLQTLNLGGE